MPHAILQEKLMKTAGSIKEHGAIRETAIAIDETAKAAQETAETVRVAAREVGEATPITSETVKKTGRKPERPTRSADAH